MRPSTRVRHRQPSPRLHPIESMELACVVLAAPDYETVARRRRVVRRLRLALYAIASLAAFAVGVWLGAA